MLRFYHISSEPLPPPTPSVVLWVVNACPIARYMPFTCPGGYPCCPGFRVNHHTPRWRSWSERYPGEYSVWCNSKCALFYSIEASWYAMFSLLENVSEGQFRSARHSSAPDASTPRLWKAVTHAPLEAIAAMTKVRFQRPLACK